MSKHHVTDLITDREMAFARLVLSGTMTDRDAAQAAGLSPDTAAYTKAKPRVRDYMLKHRAAVQQKLADKEAEQQQQRDLMREKVLDRLWQIANLSPEMTRGSITGQVKALSMIVAMQSLIPDRRAASSERKSAPPATRSHMDTFAWPGPQPGETANIEPDPMSAHEEEQAGLIERARVSGAAEDAPSPLSPIPGRTSNLGQSAFVASANASMFAAPVAG